MGAAAGDGFGADFAGALVGVLAEEAAGFAGDLGTGTGVAGAAFGVAGLEGSMLIEGSKG